MLISIKIFLIKVLATQKKVADRKIVKLLSKELYVKKNHHLANYFFETMNSFAAYKSKDELEYLAKIMVRAINEGSSNTEKEIGKLDGKLEKLSKMIPPPWSIPKEIEEKIKKITPS